MRNVTNTHRPGPVVALTLVLCGAPFGATAGGGGLSLGGLSVGGDSALGVDLDIGGMDVEASIGGGSLADACVGSCDAPAGGGGSGGGAGGGTGGGTGGGAGTGDGMGSGTGNGIAGDSRRDAPVARRAAAVAAIGGADCRSGGNAQIYQGFAVRDRSGAVIGSVRNVTLGGDRSILGMDIRTTRGRCVGLRGGSYSVAGNEVSVNLDGSRLR